MKKLKPFVGLISICLLSLIQNCGLDIKETDTYFKWVSKGNTLTYDLNTKDNKISNYRILEIIDEPGVRTNLYFSETIPETSNDPNQGYLLLGLDFAIYRLNDGLHTTACYSCQANPCLSVIDYLKIPARPASHQSIPDYFCKDNIQTYEIIINTDSLITVPLGNFKTFVINDTLNRTVKFWNEGIGLIRVDNYNGQFKDTVKLELSKKSY